MPEQSAEWKKRDVLLTVFVELGMSARLFEIPVIPLKYHGARILHPIFKNV